MVSRTVMLALIICHVYLRQCHNGKCNAAVLQMRIDRWISK